MVTRCGSADKEEVVELSYPFEGQRIIIDITRDCSDAADMKWSVAEHLAHRQERFPATAHNERRPFSDRDGDSRWQATAVVFMTVEDVGNNSTCLLQCSGDASHNMAKVGGKFVSLCCKDGMNNVQPALLGWVLHEDVVTFDFVFATCTFLFYGRVLKTTFNGALDGDKHAIDSMQNAVNNLGIGSGVHNMAGDFYHGMTIPSDKLLGKMKGTCQPLITMPLVTVRTQAASFGCVATFSMP